MVLEYTFGGFHTVGGRAVSSGSLLCSPYGVILLVVRIVLEVGSVGDLWIVVLGWRAFHGVRWVRACLEDGVLRTDGGLC